MQVNAEVLLQQCQMAIHQAVRMGQTPIVFTMNENTRTVISDAVLAASSHRESRFQALKRKLLHRPLPKLQAIFGVPVVVNAHLSDNVISLQWVPNIAVQHGAPVMTNNTAVTVGNGPSPDPPVQDNPFVKTEVVDQAQAPSAVPDRVSLDDLSQQNSQSRLPSVTDVLIKGMDNLEAVTHVVVIRKYHSGNIDMGMSCDPDEAVGIVQKAQIWLAQREH